jgi:uncharacterized protein GlcG (DUF336 family)
MNRLMLCVVLALCSADAGAQLPNPFGVPVDVDTAKKVAAAAVAEARKNSWNLAIAVADTHGELVYFEKMDGTQMGSVDVAQQKARSAARYKRPTKAFQDALAAGGEGLRVLRLEGAIPVEGGYPLLLDGRIVGAIGCSGATSAQDGMACKAGADSLLPKP